MWWNHHEDKMKFKEGPDLFKISPVGKKKNVELDPFFIMVPRCCCFVFFCNPPLQFIASYPLPFEGNTQESRDQQRASLFIRPLLSTLLQWCCASHWLSCTSQLKLTANELLERLLKSQSYIYLHNKNPLKQESPTCLT